MSIILKTDPVGVDRLIQNVQQELFDLVSWNDAPKTYESYGRAYRNKDENENGEIKMPEVFCGGNDVGDIDYKEVFMDDGFSATSFFLVDDRRRFSGGLSEIKMHIVFQVLLNELYPTIDHRPDEEAHQEVYDTLYGNGYGLEVSDLEVGVENVYKSLAFSDKYCDDMHPYHVFKYSLTGDVLLKCIKNC